MQNYRGKAFGTLAPHVFALAESAYSSLQVSTVISTMIIYFISDDFCTHMTIMRT